VLREQLTKCNVKLKAHLAESMDAARQQAEAVDA
jgi:hypothetical protein